MFIRQAGHVMKVGVPALVAAFGDFGAALDSGPRGGRGSSRFFLLVLATIAVADVARGRPALVDPAGARAAGRAIRSRLGASLPGRARGTGTDRWRRGAARLAGLSRRGPSLVQRRHSPGRLRRCLVARHRLLAPLRVRLPADRPAGSAGGAAVRHERRRSMANAPPGLAARPDRRPVAGSQLRARRLAGAGRRRCGLADPRGPRRALDPAGVHRALARRGEALAGRPGPSGAVERLSRQALGSGCQHSVRRPDCDPDLRRGHRASQRAERRSADPEPHHRHPDVRDAAAGGGAAPRQPARRISRRPTTANGCPTSWRAAREFSS